MLASKYSRGTARCVASLAPKNFALALIWSPVLQFMVATPRKLVPAPPSSSPGSFQPHRVAGRELTRSQGASETLGLDNESSSMRIVGRGGCSPGLSIRSFLSKQTQRGARKLIWDLSMRRYWLSGTFIRYPRWMQLRPKSFRCSRENYEGRWNPAICIDRSA